MTAPVATRLQSVGFRDSKGNTSRVTCIIGAATNGAVDTAVASLGTVLQAVTNSAAYFTNDANAGNKRVYGTSATYQNVEDKAILTFTSPTGTMHRYQIPAPKAAGFYADAETVLSTETNMAALISFFQTSVYGNVTDTAPLAFIGGLRLRRSMHRKATIFTKDPPLTAPEA